LEKARPRPPPARSATSGIDPFGFALEKYDPIGRLRDKDLGGRPVDAKAKLKDGTEYLKVSKGCDSTS